MQKGVDHIGVSVIYFCHDGKGNFVLAKRGTNARDEHAAWDVGGGAVELGTSVEETLKKEIKEEYCTDVLHAEFLGFRDVQRTHSGTKTHWLALDFKILVDPKLVKNGEPHKFDEVGWFTLDKLPQNLHSQLSFALEKYKSKLA